MSFTKEEKNILKIAGLSAIAIMMAFIVWDSVFIVREDEQALVTQFGQYRRTYKKAGLYFKMPVVQNVEIYEKRVLSLEIPASELTLKDQKRLVVDLFIRYEIVEPMEFYKRLRSEKAARNRLSYAAVSALRNVLGSYTLTEVLTQKRVEVMLKIKEMLEGVSCQLGLKITDVRISKTDLPNENRDAVYKKMISALRREAQSWRGKGKEEELKRKAMAQYESEMILAHAEQEAKSMHGQADAESLDIVNKAYVKNANFAQFYISYKSWLDGLSDKNDVFIDGEDLDKLLKDNK